MESEHIEDGFIVLSRQIMKSAVWQSEGLLKVWIWCLLKANHAEEWVPIKTGRGVKSVFIKRGQFIFGRKSAAKKLKMNPSTVLYRLKKLQNMRNLDTQADTHYTLVSICNYERYQNIDNYYRQDNRQPTDNQLTTNRQPTDTNKNVKNDNNTKNKEYMSIFDEARRLYPGTKRGLNVEFENFQKKCKDWKEVLPELKPAIQKQIKYRQQQRAANIKETFWKYFQTWINNSCWEEEQSKITKPNKVGDETDTIKQMDDIAASESVEIKEVSVEPEKEPKKDDNPF